MKRYLLHLALLLITLASLGSASLRFLNKPMPTNIDVNGVQWHVQVVSTIEGPTSGVVGYTECSLKRIYLTKDGKDRQTTLLHELMHTAVCKDDFDVNNLYYNSLTNGGHEGIYKTSEILEELLRRNPALAAYLGQA